MDTLREGYSVGSDDTEWRRYIMDSMSELGVGVDMQGNQPARNRPAASTDKKVEDFHDIVQKLIGGIKI
jgi:hypothetical protein